MKERRLFTHFLLLAESKVSGFRTPDGPRLLNEFIDPLSGTEAAPPTAQSMPPAATVEGLY